MRKILALLALCLLMPSLAQAAVTNWTSSPTFAAGSDDTTPVFSPGVILFWGARGGTEASPTFEVQPGTRVKLIWDADTTGAGTVTVDVDEASGLGTGASEWETLWNLPAATSCEPPATSCSIFTIETPGIYRLNPSAQGSNSRLKAIGY